MHTIIIIDEESRNVNEYNHIPDLRVTSTVSVECREINIGCFSPIKSEYEMYFTLANPDDALVYNLTSKKKGAYGGIL